MWKSNALFKAWGARRRGLIRRFARGRDGATTIEFVILAPLFFIVVFAIIEVALISLSRTTIRAGLSDVGREVRIGQAQCLSRQQVIEAVCRFSLVSGCAVDMAINQSVVSDGGSGDVNDFSGLDSGDIVILQASYSWEVLNPLLSPLLGGDDGDLPISSSIVFKNERFEDVSCPQA